MPEPPITTEAALTAAIQAIDRLMSLGDLSPEDIRRLDDLADRVEVYEDEHYPIPDAPHGDVLRHLLDSNRASMFDVGARVGISDMSMDSILKGLRRATADEVERLSGFFHVDPRVFD